jgi:enamine deaminase RidA (YjgF/YER057c/UK114 family)
MKRMHLNPPELPDWSSLFSQVVVAEGSPLRIVVTSGQVGVDAHQAVAGDGSFEAQVEQAFANLAVAISAGGCSPRDVAKLTIYVVGYEPGKVDAIGTP